MAYFADEHVKDKVTSSVENSPFKRTTYAPPARNKETPLSRKNIMAFSTSDRATKRVIAPYVRVTRRGQLPLKDEREEEESKHFKFYLQKKPSVLMRNLSAFLSETVDLPLVMHETVDILKDVLKSAGVTLYIVDETAKELYQSPRNVLSDRHKVNWKIETGKTVAAHVAYTKEHVMVDDVLMDERFSEGIGYKDETVKSLLCVPVMTPSNECVAVIELYRDVTQDNFVDDNLQLVVVVTGWMGAAIHQSQQRMALQKQQELNDYLLDLIKCYFADTVSIEMLISEVVGFAKQTLGAEKGSFYRFIENSDCLEADVFEEGIDETASKYGEKHYRLFQKNLRVKLEKGYGIPGLVARTCEHVNVADAQKDPRFDPEVDSKRRMIVRSVLCMPVMAVNGILGIIQLTNKTTGVYFTSEDERLLKTFSMYCSLALHHANLSKTQYKSKKLNESYLDLLRFHMLPCPDDLKDFKERPTIDKPVGFDSYAWHITSDLYQYMPQLVYMMMADVMGASSLNLHQTLQFILSVRKSYRNNFYHSFEHAFTVCHCMYLMVRTNRNRFNPLESKALILAALCHDLDHKAYTNNFLQLTDNVLSQLYDDSYLENHHFMVTMLLLTDSGILKKTTSAEFVELRKHLRHLILATDLTRYFKTRGQLIHLWCDGGADTTWNNADYRFLVRDLMMTIADLAAMCKPFKYAKKIVDNIYREFYNQGDIEKSLHLCPLSVMDREKQHLVPEDQVQFLSVIVIPAVEMLILALPNACDLLTGAQNLQNIWHEIIELRGSKCWRQDDSIVVDE